MFATKICSSVLIVSLFITNLHAYDDYFSDDEHNIQENDNPNQPPGMLT